MPLMSINTLCICSQRFKYISTEEAFKVWHSTKNNVAILDFFRKVLRNTYDLTDHEQSNLRSKKYLNIDFKNKNY